MISVITDMATLSGKVSKAYVHLSATFADIACSFRPRPCFCGKYRRHLVLLYCTWFTDFGLAVSSIEKLEMLPSIAWKSFVRSCFISESVCVRPVLNVGIQSGGFVVLLEPLLASANFSEERAVSSRTKSSCKQKGKGLCECRWHLQG